MPEFYDSLASLYHLVYQDWPASVRLQGAQLAALIHAEWPARRRLLDVSCGIGTQAIGLALQGFAVTGSDVSAGAIERARQEAGRWGVSLALSVCDVRQAQDHHGAGFDVVISADNSLPHLLTDQDLLLALEQMRACLAPGGGCVITLRDYAREERGRHLVKPYGVRLENGRRYLLFQVWDFDADGERYDLGFYFVEEDLHTRQVHTHVMRSRYYALSTDRLCELMRVAGFRQVRRIDDAFYQPVLVGTQPG
ncbi:MAG TPA: class I SAM-dependent methyltransferase [Burkholderiaceae bacterium]|nr:class I SAM-dependent methyltransferase [Burkholderiaceae bacterium]